MGQRVGTFIRTKAIDSALLAAVQNDNVPTRHQVLVLGAGFDTRWFRLHEQLAPSCSAYVELDFAEVVAEKTAALGDLPSFRDPRYRLVAADLHEEPALVVSRLLRDTGLDPGAPLLLLAECCFMYLRRSALHALLRALYARWGPPGNLSVIIFDALLIRDDPFTLQMLENFARRGIHLDRDWLVPSTRPISALWSVCGQDDADPSCTLLTMRALEHSSALLSRADRSMLARMAALDEYEEWDLIAAHYYFARFTLKAHPGQEF